MKKSIISLLVLIIVLAGVYYFFQNKMPVFSINDSKSADQIVADPVKLDSLVKNSSISIEKAALDNSGKKILTPVQLKNGVGEFVLDPATDIKGDVFLISVLGQLKTVDGYDIFADLAISTGGTGIFHNVAIFHLDSNGLKFISMQPLGDRIKTLSASAVTTADNTYELSVKYLDRSPNDPMTSDPSIRQEAKFLVVDHRIK